MPTSTCLHLHKQPKGETFNATTLAVKNMREKREDTLKNVAHCLRKRKEKEMVARGIPSIKWLLNRTELI